MLEGTTESAAKSKTKGALTGVKEKAAEVIESVRGDSDDVQERWAPAERRPKAAQGREATMPLHLYCVVRSNHPTSPGLLGVGEPPGPVSVLEAGGLGVAVSPINADATLRETDAVRHLDVLIALLSDGPVVPVRFGTVAPDADAVVNEVLRPAAEELATNLDALDGLVELQIVVTANEDDELAAIVAEHPELRVQASDAASAPLAERIALGEIFDAQLGERRRHRTELIDQRLVPRCRAVRDLSGADPTTSRFAALVPIAELDEFDSVIGRLFNELGPGYESEYIGPLPAADFVGLGRPDPRSRERWGWTGSESPTGRWGW